MKRFGTVFAASLLALIVVGCSGDKDSSPDEATASALKSSAGNALLEYIPADTPYFFGTLAPMDDDIIAAMREMNEDVLKSYGDVMKSALNDARSDSDEADEFADSVGPVLEKLASYFEDGKLDELGIGDDVTGGFYGVGLLPVLRIRLDDTAQFEKGVAELETSAGQEMASASIKGVDYRYAGDDEAKLIIANESDFAVVTFLPGGASDDALASILGIDKPANSLGDTDRVTSLSANHGMLPQGLGFIDLTAIAETFLTEQQGVNAELMAIGGYDPSSISDVCKTEIRAMSQVMPQIDMGYTRIETKRFDLLTVVNLRNDIATSMQGLTAAVPGLGGAMEGLFSFGVSMNIPAIRDFISERAAALDENPFECEFFFDLQDSVAQMDEAANQPLPPVADSLRGFKLIVDKLENLDLAGGTPPDVAGRALISIDDAPSLLMMGQMFLPQLSQLQLEPNGEAVELPPGLIPMSTDPAFVALTDSAIALGLGADAGDGLAALFEAPVANAQPMLSVSYDMGEYMALMGSVVDQATADSTEPGQVAVADMFESMQEYMDRTWLDITVTEKGIEMPYAVTLK
ncbi:MAG: hypothetical protein AAGC71_09520 [Pseudomonadota bacterium]